MRRSGRKQSLARRLRDAFTDPVCRLGRDTVGITRQRSETATRSVRDLRSWAMTTHLKPPAERLFAPPSGRRRSRRIVAREGSWPIYEELFRTVRLVNTSIPRERQLRVL